MSNYYDIHVFCCTNQRPAGHPRVSCGKQGSIDLHAAMKARVKSLNIDKNIRVNKSGCLDRCELGPTVVIYPEGIWYHVATTADVDEIIDQHIIAGKPVARLLLAADAKKPPQG